MEAHWQNPFVQVVPVVQLAQSSFVQHADVQIAFTQVRPVAQSVLLWQLGWRAVLG